MRLITIPAFLLYLAAASSQASAIVTLGQSTQDFALTGIGANSAGEGQSKMTWGSCPFDGTTTTCTLSGPFTGLGEGGTYSLIVSYPGNGPFPLIAVSQSPGSDFFFTQAAANNYSFVLTLAETNGPAISFYSYANFSIFFAASLFKCTVVPTNGCGVGQVGLTSNATITGPIIGSFDPTPHITPSGVISAGNYGAFPAIAPATWIEIYGVNLATTRSQTWAGGDFHGSQAPSALGGTTVTVAGMPAYVDFVSPGQVNVQIPSGVPTGSQSLVVTTAGGSSVDYAITVNPVEPGLLAPPSFSLNGAQNIAAVFSNTLRFVYPISVPGALTARARPGDNITLYGIGFGPVTPDIPAGQIVQQTNALQNALQVTLGNVPAQITYAGLAPGYVGLYQINVVVPQVSASDKVPIAFTLNGVSGLQTLVIAVQN